MASSDDLALDIEELKQLHSIAKRPRVVSLISSEIRNLEKVSSLCYALSSILNVSFLFFIFYSIFIIRNDFRVY